jgi:hypothetical protein
VESSRDPRLMAHLLPSALMIKTRLPQKRIPIAGVKSIRAGIHGLSF